MTNLTPEGERLVAAIADRYQIAIDSVKIMFDAVIRGGGSMAQFNLSEFGGGGQWMRGGMTMVGDMFNNSAKVTVDNLCNELSNLMFQPGIFAPQPQQQPYANQNHSNQQQQQSGGFPGQQQQSGDYGQSQYQGGGFGQSSSGGWWPSELGNPSSTGGQNTTRYAYFPHANRLAIDYGNGRVEIYDTTGYSVYGFGQQQGGGESMTFSSQNGTVRIDTLPRVGGAAGQNAPAAVSHGGEHASPAAVTTSGATTVSELQNAGLALLEQLGGLRDKGYISEEEFAAKKAEILKRL
ncbi:SHOCT domain-containing protein [Rhodomicrobium lacus]|uniref:SHOCT domain-containing protein n=1 Tax=Rhodomicrobium lacus TaxID=2498452 RepID=UPI000F8ED1AB|nr:SHOCT domain-containing protein [Rhodomicrobium lacus]